MAFVIKFIKGVRNHWKKSTFAAVALAYGTNYAIESYKTQELMRAYCEEARKFGNQPIAGGEIPRKITVILNPNANKRKAAKLFENYCAPILHLAGICVDIIQTQSEGHAKTLMEELPQTPDAIIVAGGDGTLSEVITGLMRRSDHQFILKSIPIGILPLGRTNTLASFLFPVQTEISDSLKTITSLADASLAIVKEHTKQTSIMRIEQLTNDDQHTETIATTDESKTPTANKPVFALGQLEWGAYRDVDSKREKYWYFGPLRNYVAYIFNGYKSSITWNCAAEINYSPPCSGCRNCYQQNNEINSHSSAANTRWWGNFVSTKSKSLVANESIENYSNIINENCPNTQTKNISTSDFSLANDFQSEALPQLKLRLGPSEKTLSYVDFVSEGWKSVRGEDRTVTEEITARQVEIIPEGNDDTTELWFSIDREDFEVKPVRITLIPNVLKVFCNGK